MFLYNINEAFGNGKCQCPGHTPLSITSLAHYQSPLSPPLPAERLLGSSSCDPPWASSTLTNDDNILNWSGSPISGTQTQISGSSPVKRAPGTLPQLPNLNQQCSRENDNAWTAAAFAPRYLCQASASPTSSFVSHSPSVCLCHSSKYLNLLSWKIMLEDNTEYDLSERMFGKYPRLPNSSLGWLEAHVL